MSRSARFHSLGFSASRLCCPVRVNFCNSPCAMVRISASRSVSLRASFATLSVF